ncbi:MAG TPA: TetR/AcrR family transcriptional regulator [Ktedonobacteraceae bacterium]
MAPSTRKLDPRVKRTRQLLQQTFNELMQEKNFSAISIQDIAERATVNRATSYTHFEDKYQLLDYMLQEQFQQMVENKLPQVPRWEESTLHILIKAVLEYFREIHKVHYCPSVSMLDPIIEPTVQRKLYDLLVIWLKQASVPEPARSVPGEVLALTTSWAIFGAANQWSRDTQTISLEHMTDALLTVVTEGVAYLTPGFRQK